MLPIRLGNDYSAISPLFREFDRLFENFGYAGLSDARHTGPHFVTRREQDRYEIVADMPGLGDKDIAVDLHRGVLTISGQSESTSTPGEATHRERRAYKFSHSVRLPEEVDDERVSAHVKDGVLTVSLPKKEAVKPRQIPVSAN